MPGDDKVPELGTWGKISEPINPDFLFPEYRALYRGDRCLAHAHTFSEWSGVEWSGVEWSGVEWML